MTTQFSTVCTKAERKNTEIDAREHLMQFSNHLHIISAKTKNLTKNEYLNTQEDVANLLNEAHETIDLLIHMYTQEFNLVEQLVNERKMLDAHLRELGFRVENA